MSPSERWALTPPFHPYRLARAKRRRPAGLPTRYHRAALAGGLSFCGTIREPWHRLWPVLNARRARCIWRKRTAQTEVCATVPLALPGALPTCPKAREARQRVLYVWFASEPNF